MTLLFAGTSLADFYVTGSAVTTTTANVGLGVIEGILFDNGSAANRASLSFNIEGKSDFWISLYWRNPAGASSSGADYDWIGFYNQAYSTVNPLLKIKSTSTPSNVFNIMYWDGAAFQTDNVVPNMLNAPLRRYDIHIVIADTGGKFDVYENSGLIASAAITDTKLVGASVIDLIRVSQYKANLSAGQNTFSAIFVMDEDTRKYEFFQRNPTANGAETSWTGVYTDVAKTTINDATMIYTNTIGQFETYTKGALPVQYANSVVAGVVLSARARSGDVGINGVARVGGVNFDVTPEYPVVTIFNPLHFHFDVNPATGLPWTISEIDAAQFGVKSV